MSGDDPLPGPAWTPDIWISPSKLRTYANCPYRVRLEYLDKVAAPRPFNLFLAKGNIAHDLLRLNAQLIRAGKPPLAEADVGKRAWYRLPAREFHSAAARHGAVNDVLRWVHYGTKHIDRAGEFLNIEKPGKRQVPVPAIGARLTISTRPDLIQIRTDADGERYIEIIDYKTGSMSYIDEVPPVAMRFVFKELFQTVSAGTLSLRMQFTYVYLDHADRHVIPLTPEYLDAQWAAITSTIERLVTEREWPSTPSKLCHYCPYNGVACHAFDTWLEDPDGRWE